LLVFSFELTENKGSSLVGFEFIDCKLKTHHATAVDISMVFAWSYVINSMSRQETGTGYLLTQKQNYSNDTRRME
jgi:hypothetical protein